MEVKNTLKYCKIFANFDQEFINTIRRACVFLENEAFVVDNNDDVYYLVNNRKYKVDFLCGKNVQNFTFNYLPGSNNYHMMARTFDSKLYLWGRNTFDQVIKNRELEVYTPIRKRLYYGGIDKILNNVSDNFYRFSETFLLKSCGLPSIWNCLGNLFDPSKRFSMMACGATHSMAVTVENTIIVWGGNRFGQIGNGTIKSNESETPFVILVKKTHTEEYPPLNPCECICCVSSTSTGLIGSIFCCVYCPIGLLAVPFSFCYCCCKCMNKERVIIQEEVPIQTIACGSYHNLVLFENKRLWGWGSNNLGQLGRFPTSCIVKPVPIFDHVVAIATFNSHTLVLCEDGVLHGMGSNQYGQLGSYYNKHIFLNNPQTFDLKFDEIATINSICVGKGKDGLFYAWGLYKVEEFRRSDKKEHQDTAFIKDVNRAYIIDQPKVVRCNSFNEFFVKQASLTYYTVDLINRHENWVLNKPGTSNRVAVNQKELPLIDESELKIIEHFERDDLNQGLTNNIRIGDEQKFSIFDNCPNIGTTNISNVKMTGKKSAMQSMRDLFN